MEAFLAFFFPVMEVETLIQEFVSLENHQKFNKMSSQTVTLKNCFHRTDIFLV